LLEDDDPDTVERMLLYLYTCDYDDGIPDEAASCSKEEEANGEGEDTAETVPTESPEEEAMVEVSEGKSNTEESLLLNNVMVYAIAERYDISELKELAKAKFLSQADTLLSSHEFPEVVKTIYTSTLSKDRGLRDIVSQVCVKHVRELMEDQAFQGIISDVGDFGIDILREALKHDDERLAQVMDQRAKLKDIAKEIQAKMLNLESDMNQAKLTLKRVVRIVNETESCRNCGAGFCGHIDETSPAVLQCVKCQVRHRVF
jgi:hypothetical protein